MPHQHPESDVTIDLLTREVDQVVHELQEIKDELYAIENAQHLHVPEMLHPIRLKLGKLSTRSFHGKFDIAGKLYDLSHTLIGDLLDDCHLLVSKYLTQSDYYKVSKSLRPIHDRLSHIVYALQEMNVSGDDIQPSMLLPYRRALGDLEGRYHDGGFDCSKDPTDNSPNFPEGQAVVVGLFNQAHELIQKLKMRTDFYSFNELLKPLHDSLQTMIVTLQAYEDSQSVPDKKNIAGLQKKNRLIF